MWRIRLVHDVGNFGNQTARFWQYDWWPACFASPLDLLKKNTTGHAVTKLIGQPQWWWVKFITGKSSVQTKHTLANKTIWKHTVLTQSQGDYLQTQGGETLWNIGLWKRWLLILALGLIEKKWKYKKILKLFCAVYENCQLQNKTMYVA